MRPTRLALSALLAALAAAPARPAALDRFEIQVYGPDLQEPGHLGLELHSNYTIEGEKTPAYPGEIPPDGTARFTVTSWARSIVSAQEGVDVPLDGRSATAAYVVLPLIAIAGWVVATLRYRRADVD